SSSNFPPPVDAQNPPFLSPLAAGRGLPYKPYHPPSFFQLKTLFMIQWMHRLSQSWVATLLMAGLALSFVIWVIADIFTGQTTTSVASVGSTQIEVTAFQRFYKEFLRAQSQQMGTEITPDMAQKL